VLGQVRSCALVGVDAVAVEVEVMAIVGDKPSFQIVGLGDSAVREAKGRVVSALKRSGCQPPEVIFVNLAPAEVKKEGSAFDLPMALGVAISGRRIKAQRGRSTFYFGELSLDGSVRAVRGVVALAISALENGADTVVVPMINVAEAALVRGLRVIGVRTLTEALQVAEGNIENVTHAPAVLPLPSTSPANVESLAQVRGQLIAKRAMLLAAAGGHNLIFIGPPGCGKSMLAQRFANLLPQLNEQEQFEAVKIHSIAGLSVNTLLAGRRPFRNPHHVVSDVGLIGGGSSPRPGEISLAHRGVLFLDEFPEYRRSALEALRTPLETGEVRISRAKASTLLPARFQLLAAMNPCPCGRLGSKQRCICSDSMLQGYLRKLSQPILERIDIQVELEEVSFAEMTDRSTIGDLSDEHLQSKVQQMMELQHMRQGALNCRLEGETLMSSEQLAAQAMKLLEETAKRNLISARSFIRILRIARTIADLDGTAQILDRHVAEAIGFRLLDRRTQRTISGLANS